MKFKSFLDRQELRDWQDHFNEAITRRTDPKRHGDLNDWLTILDNLPAVKPSVIDLNRNRIKIGKSNDLSTTEKELLNKGLMGLAPWRKGPFELFGKHIDSEWRSDWKWRRLEPNISDLTNKSILDVGCGNGYHCWRMLGAGARYVMGIDPSMRFLIQHRAINFYANDERFDFIPIGLEDMPIDMPIFDTIFSMGVLYHRRNPINHLLELKNLMQKGGELVIETLIVDNIAGGIFQPKERYAQMRNVWSIMTIDKILSLLNEAGFKHARCVDQNTTSLEEQRRTDWMSFHSLENFLDPDDHSLTIEGYPAPKRGIFIAEK